MARYNFVWGSIESGTSGLVTAKQRTWLINKREQVVMCLRNGWFKIFVDGTDYR